MGAFSVPSYYWYITPNLMERSKLDIKKTSFSRLFLCGYSVSAIKLEDQMGTMVDQLRAQVNPSCFLSDSLRANTETQPKCSIPCKINYQVRFPPPEFTVTLKNIVLWVMPRQNHAECCLIDELSLKAASSIVLVLCWSHRQLLNK